MTDNRTYWLEADAKDVANELMEYHGRWVSYSTNPIMQAWSRNTVKYFSNIIEATYWETSLSFEGDQGEFVKMLMPIARNLIRQLLTIISKQNLDFSTIARATGIDVRTITRLGDALASQIVQDEDLDRKFTNMVEYGLVQGISYTKSVWRTDRGEPWESEPLEDTEEHIAKGEHGIKYTGEAEVSIHDCYSVFFDYTIEEWEDLPWVEVRTRKNKWDLIAQHPHMEEEILALETDPRWDSYYSNELDNLLEKDQVFVYELFVKPSPALPEGRMMMYCSPDCILWDSDNLYGTIPVEQFKPEPIFKTGFGYPALSSILPAQEMLDHSFSAISTNEQAFAVKNVLVPREANVGVDQIDGMNFVSYTPGEKGGKPERLDLGASSPETFKFIELLKTFMTEVSNLNEAIRGQPLPGVTSGVAYATLTANALEFITAASKEYISVAKKTVMHSINAYRKFGGDTERMVRMTKFSNSRETSTKFVGSDLDPIQYVDLKATNPLLQTTAGREAIADKLMQYGIVKDVDDFLKVIDGEPLQALTRAVRNQNDLIENENEALQEGEKVLVVNTDDHPRHIYHHSALLDDPEIRTNADYTSNVLIHIMEHLKMEKEMDPMLAAIVRTGKAPLPEQGALPPMGGTMDQQGGPTEVLMPEEGPGVEAQSDLIQQGAVTPAAPADDLLGRI